MEKKIIYKSLGVSSAGVASTPLATAVNSERDIKVSIPEIRPLIKSIEDLISCQKHSHIELVQKEPVIHVNIPEYPTPIVNIETPKTEVEVHPMKVEVILGKAWQIYMLLFGVYFLIFLLAWHYLPSFNI